MKKIVSNEDVKNKAIQEALRSPAPKIVRRVGQVNWIEVDGERIYRQERLVLKTYKDEFPDGIPCSPYDNHFLYINKRKLGSSILCSCGSMGVIANYDMYKKYGSNQGALIVCYQQILTGRHADGSQ